MSNSLNNQQSVSEEQIADAYERIKEHNLEQQYEDYCQIHGLDIKEHDPRTFFIWLSFSL